MSLNSNIYTSNSIDPMGRKAARVTLKVQVKLVKTMDERFIAEAKTLRRRNAFQKRGAKHGENWQQISG